MNRQEFMERLEYLLRGIPASEREDALAYYNDYFDEAGVENEYQVIQELGSPEQVAQTILADVQQARQEYSGPESEMYQSTSNKYEHKEKQGMSKSTKILVVVLLVITFPIWIGIVAGVFGTVVGLIGAAFGIAIGIAGAAVGLIGGGVLGTIRGIAIFAQNPVEGLASIGFGLFLVALGLLLVLLCVWCLGVWLPKGIRALVQWVKRLFHREEGGNEI